MSMLLRSLAAPLLATLLLGAAGPARAQDDDAPAVVTPAWATGVRRLLDAERYDAALAALRRLLPARANDYVYHVYVAEAWEGKWSETDDEREEIRFLQEARANLLRARQLASAAGSRAPQADRAAVAERLRDIESSLREAGVALAAAPASAPAAAPAAAAATAPAAAPAPVAAARPAGPPPAAAGPVEQPPAARIANGAPVGLFFMTRFWGGTGTLEKSVWYFAPGGRVYQDLETGFSAADLAAHRGPQGTYRPAGGELRVTWADGKTTASAMTTSGTGFSWNGGIFTAVQPFAAARSVAGTYEGGETLSAGPGNSAATSKTLELRPDGTFRWQGVAFVQSRSSESQLSAGARGGGTAGTWRVAGYSLVLTDAAGSVLRRIAFPYDDKATPVYPDRMFFGGTMYKRQ